MGWIMFPYNSGWVLAPSTSECDLTTVVADVIRIKLWPYWSRKGHYTNDWCPYRKVDEGRKYLQSSTSQGRPEVASKRSEVGYKHGTDTSPQLSKEPILKYLGGLLASRAARQCITVA